MVVEAPARIEPAGIEEMISAPLSDLALQITSESSLLRSDLHAATLREIRALMRIMNAYYSNQIEGHNTRPRDIEAALAGRAVDADRRNLAEEAAPMSGFRSGLTILRITENFQSQPQSHS